MIKLSSSYYTDKCNLNGRTSCPKVCKRNLKSIDVLLNFFFLIFIKWVPLAVFDSLQVPRFCELLPHSVLFPLFGCLCYYHCQVKQSFTTQEPV